MCVICQGLGNELAQRGISRRKIQVVYNGINPRDFQPSGDPADPLFSGLKNTKKKVGFIGSFFRYEGLDLLVRAFADLVKQRDDILLVLVGGGRCEKEIKALVEEMGMGPHVLMPGRVRHDKVGQAYRAMDVLVYPRTPVRLTELVTPLKPLEAMLMEKSALASDVGGHKELIRDGKTGMLFSAGSVDDLKEKLTTLLDDPALRIRLGRSGRKWVLDHHTWPVTTAVYSIVYHQALSGRKGSA